MVPRTLAAALLFLASAGEASAEEPREALRGRPTSPSGATVTAASLYRIDAHGAQSPREALLLLEEAARSGDPERAAPLFAEPFGSALRRTFAAGRLMLDASRRLHSVVERKLGREAVRTLMLERRVQAIPRASFDEAIEIVSITQARGCAKAVIRPKTRYGLGREEALELVEQEGAWRLVPPARDGRLFGEQELLEMELLTRGLENAAAAVVKLAGDVEWDVVTEVADCRRRLEEADLEIGRSLGDEFELDESPIVERP